MGNRFSTLLRAFGLALALLLGLIGANTVAAQDETEVPADDAVEVQTDTVAEEEDEGFDDWGLLGLLGLGGLAGLLRRPQPPVVVDPPVTRTTIDRTTDTTRR